MGYTGKRSFKLLKKKNYENSCFLILEAMIDDYDFILINQKRAGFYMGKNESDATNI